MPIQWLAGVAFAFWVSPKVWAGQYSAIHPHVWAALFLGAAVTFWPVYCAIKWPGTMQTRHMIAIGQMLMSALLIHLTGGRIETHFHVFGSLAFLAFYRDWRVLVSASAIVALDHLLRGIYFPLSVFGVLTASPYRWLEHAGWVVFEDIFLIVAIRQSLAEMLGIAERQANLEALNANIEHKVAERTEELTKEINERKQIKADLIYERHLLHTLLENSADRIYFKDRNSRFLKSSKAHAERFQVNSPDDLIGKDDFDFFTEEHARPAFEDEQEIIRTGRPIVAKIEKQVLKNNGEVTWSLTTKGVLRDQTGNIIGTFGISKDITKIKEAEAKLEEANNQLVEASRKAGMAEVATSVLHNVGNVLNSVNVSHSVITDKVSKSRISSMVKTANLLREHAGDLPAFLTTDPAGQKLPDFLGKLSERLLQEQEALLAELQLLGQNIGHIKEIIAVQQTYAHTGGVHETMPVDSLMEDALQINGASLARHQIDLVRDYGETPPVSLEKHKVLQILVNLVSNAKYALIESNRGNRRIIARTACENGHVTVSVTDNGVGIAPENLTRIFAHGFTTKKDGHGFGLHSGVLAAQEMGGSLAVHSDGPGTGATFTLKLPLNRNGNGSQ